MKAVLPATDSFRAGAKACVPTIMGYLGIGVACGVVSSNTGLDVLTIFLMAAIIYGGSAQFIICGMLAANSSISAIVFTTFLVNFRHFLMSMSVAPYFKESSLFHAIGIGSLITDESYGVLVTQLKNSGEHEKVSESWVHGLNLTAYAVWIVATVLGGVLGSVLPNPEALGLDFSLVAMFIGLVVLQIDLPLKKQTKKTLLIVFSVLISLFLLLSFCSKEVAVLISTLIGCLVGVKLHDSK